MELKVKNGSNVSFVRMCSIHDAHGRKAVSRWWEEITTRPRGCSRRRRKGRHPRVYAYAYARACERVSLSSVVHISVVRCTLFRCLRGLAGRGKGEFHRYCFFFFRAKHGRIRIYDPSNERIDQRWFCELSQLLIIIIYKLCVFRIFITK